MGQWIFDEHANDRCVSPLGPVADEEEVARITVKQVPYTGYNPFRRDDLLPPAKRSPSNECGKADGLSVDRCSDLTNDQMRLRSASRSAKANARRKIDGKPANQFPEGALVASVDALRGLRSRGAVGQFVYVYDDPIVSEEPDERNIEHAVLRMSEQIDEAFVARAIDDLLKRFARSVNAV